MSSLNQDQNGEFQCWSCRSETDTPQCLSCGKIQPPLQKDYFALLGLPGSFNLDLDCLEKKYLYLQQVVHPDRFVGKPMKEKRYASQQSSLLNQAYKVLKDPVQRGYYLLKMLDKNYREDEKHECQDQDFLMMLLIEQESIENATDLEQIQDRLVQDKEKLRIYEDAIRQAFEVQNLEAILTYLSRYQYQQVLINKATQKYNQLRN